MSGTIKKYHKVEGLKFNRLTIIKETNPKRYGVGKHLQRMVLCKCECGGEVIAKLTGVVYGKPKSCGCLWDEKMEENKPNLIHGGSYTNLFMKWSKMKDRCYNKNCKKYNIYGGRGIKVCESWLSNFESFRDWSLNNGYKKGLSLDRFPDVNGNYEHSNCRWANNKEQCNNKRNNIIVNLNGESLTLMQVSERYNISYSKLHQRYRRRKWSIEKSIIQ